MFLSGRYILEEDAVADALALADDVLDSESIEQP